MANEKLYTVKTQATNEREFAERLFALMPTNDRIKELEARIKTLEEDLNNSIVIGGNDE